MATPGLLLVLLLACLTVVSSSDYDFYEYYSDNHETLVEPLKTTPAPSIKIPTIKPELFNNASFASALLAALNRMRAEQLQSDVRLHVNSSELPVHSLVLSAVSPYFRKKLGGQTTQNETLDVVLHGVLPDILENIINYVYTGQISLSEDNVELVMIAAKKFQLESVKELCGDYLEDRLNATNCIKTFLIADNMECGKLREAALSLTRSSFEQVISHEDIFHISSDHLIEIISSDELNVPGEKMPYQTTVKWLRKNLAENPAFHKVLEHIRLPFLPAVFLHDRVSKHDVIKNSSECRILVEEALWYQIMPPYRRKSMQTERTKPRPYYTAVDISPRQAVTFGSDSSSLTVYNIPSAEWQKQLELPHRIPDLLWHD